jgi:glutathione S-transferase
MKLIGMLDSPYVRRVAISLQMLQLPFEHEAVSVFRHFEHFQAINPVVKAPTLLCDDGTVLMDSTLIIDYAEALSQTLGGRTLKPRSLADLQQQLRLIGLALAACEKAVQIIYEVQLRPADKQHAPWLERVQSQLVAACAEMEREIVRDIAQHPLAVSAESIDQAGITVAVTWCFIQANVAERVPAVDFPALAALSASAEMLPAFCAAPHGLGVVQFTH